MEASRSQPHQSATDPGTQAPSLEVVQDQQALGLLLSLGGVELSKHRNSDTETPVPTIPHPTTNTEKRSLRRHLTEVIAEMTEPGSPERISAAQGFYAVTRSLRSNSSHFESPSQNESANSSETEEHGTKDQKTSIFGLGTNAIDQKRFENMVQSFRSDQPENKKKLAIKKFFEPKLLDDPKELFNLFQDSFGKLVEQSESDDEVNNTMRTIIEGLHIAHASKLNHIEPSDKAYKLAIDRIVEYDALQSEININNPYAFHLYLTQLEFICQTVVMADRIPGRTAENFIQIAGMDITESAKEEYPINAQMLLRAVYTLSSLCDLNQHCNNKATARFIRNRGMSERSVESLEDSLDIIYQKIEKLREENILSE